jgi:MoaA/NifB/PqqE/SkfB family radical SAM enzyme
MEAHMDAALLDPTTLSSPQGLSFLWLEITGKCNLECVHCYADSGPRQDMFGQMRTEDWLRVLRDAADLGCRQVQFIGGEPTLHPDLARMISFASERGYTFIEVFTNATVLGESLLRTFVEHNVNVATSFYSDDPETHALITKHRGSFERTVEGIKRVVAAGLPIRVGIIETHENASHAERAKHFLEGLGVSEIRIDTQRGVGRGVQDLHTLQPMAELCGECWKGKLCVTSIGRAYPCVFSRFADVGSAKSGIQTIVGDDPLMEFRAALRAYRRKKGLDEISSSPEECAPDVHCEPTSSRCAPMVFGPCGPERVPPGCSPVDACSPAQHPPSCVPVDACPPAQQDIRLETCGPSCTPSMTCSPCGPTSFCVPERICAPDIKCGPTSGPCQPQGSCVPTIKGSDQIDAG